jgi:hypothetical protein
LLTWGALSDEKSGPSPMGLMNIFYCFYFPVFISPRNRVAQLYPRTLGFYFYFIFINGASKRVTL